MFTLRERKIFMNENEIINKAFLNLNQQTKIEANWRPAGNGIDGEVDIYIRGNNVHMFIEAKRELRNYQVPDLEEMAKKYQHFMVIAERIFPAVKETLREKGINYLDTAGNIYINTEGNYIWLDGKKPAQPKKPVTNRAFTKTGLKTVFYLLLNTDAVNMPYRKLAEQTQTALGNITNVIEGLRETGFILQVNDKIMQLQNKKILLERWIAGYGETLRPALEIGKFRFWDNERLANWENLPLQEGKTVWGGEPAAAHLTHYLRSEILTLYTNEEKNFIIPKWRLIPDEKGNVIVYEKFWKDNVFNNPINFNFYAPPLLVYADLMITYDPRNRETATMIYDQYLKPAFDYD